MDLTFIGCCGVDCAACSDFQTNVCLGCRQTAWGDDPCMPVECCRGKDIDCCGECERFPCGDMRAFYEESEGHRQAFALMQAMHEGRLDTD